MMVDFLSHPPLLLFHLLSLSLIACVVLWVLKNLTGTWATRVANYPPGSRGIPWIGETLAFVAANNGSKGFYDFVATRHIRYGNCFKTSIHGETHVFVSSIEAAGAILNCDSIDFSKRYIRSIAELLGDHSLLCASHEQHKLIRRRISNLFTVDSMASSINMFDELTIKTLCSWKQKGNVVVFNEALKATFTAICKMVISLEEEDKLEMLRKDVFEARRRIDDSLRKIIASRRKGLERHEDFLQCFLVRDESLHDDPWTDAQILDNILTLIIAGQITTASAIAWMVKYLDENQEVQERLRALHLDLALKLSHFPLGLEALNEMPYACKIVKESLRMATIVSWFPRVALKDCQIGGFQIKKGWIVNVDARSIHYDPTVYDDPIKFNPSRFDEDPKLYSFLAFGTGGRTCLGMNLAKAMMLVFLHRLVITFRWKVTDPDSSLEKWAMFPRLRSGCPIHVTGVGAECKLP
ncbi:abscisic acid 8'-hydroxylase 2 isoform X2 [Phoenix dactylifera]|uniref:Abscisic acid 8'-hydroxylase 2 isoform X2 n=1 Tax=Phoenix dactylifera TaxID=42345 RepID=A0A8B9A8I2_PHODC|nr:abscisic acid 8'-hydroxylase 2 isoform X2 [Phoenix dactylifera]